MFCTIMLFGRFASLKAGILGPVAARAPPYFNILVCPKRLHGKALRRSAPPRRRIEFFRGLPGTKQREKRPARLCFSRSLKSEFWDPSPRARPLTLTFQFVLKDYIARPSAGAPRRAGASNFFEVLPGTKQREKRPARLCFS